MAFPIRRMVEAVSFCMAAFTVVSIVLFCFHVPVVSTEPEAGRYSCLPGIRSDELRMTSLKEEMTVMIGAAAFDRETVLLSRGERGSGDVIQGLASWYGGSDGLDGLPTASGETFNASAYTAAHRTLAFGTLVRVTYLQTGRSVIVRINDRGPFIPGRIIDLSRAAAAEIGLLPHGVGPVQLEILK
jgi:rare lipoprotein A (peptidoglycan hydrolase)